MKQFLSIGCMSLFGALTVSAACDPIFINDSPITSPPDNTPVISATAWVNRAPFNITTLSGTGIPLPFESQCTLFFTNAPSTSPTSGGFMFFNPGVRFVYNSGSGRRWMDTWTNNGTISTDNSLIFSSILGTTFGSVISTFGGVFFGFNSTPSILLVQSTNIASTGTGKLRAGAQGLIHLEGKNINLKNNGLRTGPPPENSLFFSGGFLLSSNYVNDFGISDIWWGAGTNNTLNGRGPGMRIDNFFGFPSFNLPAPSSPDFQAIELLQGFPFTTFEFLPRFNFANYTAAVWTNQVPGSPTNFVVQVVFYPTNALDTNFTTEVRFIPGFSINGASIPVVAFHSVDFDIVDQTPITSSVYLTDVLGVATNAYLARNFAVTTRRPVTYELSRFAPFDFFFFSDTTNATFTPDLIWNPGYRSRVVTNLYAGYDGQVSSVTMASGLNGDPTNFPGRIQIIGEEVDLDKTRIRAESALNLKVTKNLSSNHLAKVDAPWVNFDVTSRAPQLLISNLAPITVRRFAGDVAAWSGTWDNHSTNVVTNFVSGAVTTNINEIFFHVLIVDPNITNVVKVTVNQFAAHATNVLIYDTLTIGKSFIVDGQSLHVKGGVFMPPGASWGATNLQQVLNFTNEGTIRIFNIANAGLDRPVPYDNYVNRGTNTAATHFIRTLNLENSGSTIASGGILQIDTLNATMLGTPLTIFTNISTNSFLFITNRMIATNTQVVTTIYTNDYGARLHGNSDVAVYAQDMVVSNSFFLAQNRLTLSVTNRLVDSGPEGINNWLTGAGVEMLTRPVISELTNTYLRLIASAFSQESFNIWCAENRGPTLAGFSNNLALAKLTLDGAPESVFHFSPPTDQANKAIYVDYLELLNNATNYNTGALDISPDFTIYFANANFNPEKLNHSNGDRLRWVTNYTGPLSSTNMTYPSGQTYTFNIVLAQSQELDSDGDGTINFRDSTPVYQSDTVGFTVGMTSGPPAMVKFSWYTLARSINRLEYNNSSPTSNNWQLMSTIINGPTNGILRAEDTVPASGKRFYRIRVDLP